MKTNPTYITIPAQFGYFVVSYLIDENGESKSLTAIVAWEVEQPSEGCTEQINDKTRPVTAEGVEPIGVATETSVKGIYGPDAKYAIPLRREGMELDEFLQFARTQCLIAKGLKRLL